MHVDETQTWDLCSTITVLPLGREGSLAFTLQKAFISITLTSSSL